MRLQITTLALLSLCLAACGPDDENGDANSANNPATNNTANNNPTNGDTEPVQASVTDGPGGEVDCPRGMASPDDVPDAADILSVAADYDGSEGILTITFAGDAQSLVASDDGTSFTGYFQAEIGTVYPFQVNQGFWENGRDSLASEFASEWTSPTEVVITISGFEAGSPITSAEVFTQAATDNWCDRVELDF